MRREPAPTKPAAKIKVADKQCLLNRQLKLHHVLCCGVVAAAAAADDDDDDYDYDNDNDDAEEDYDDFITQEESLNAEFC